jgi:hypothetical protein
MISLGVTLRWPGELFFRQLAGTFFVESQQRNLTMQDSDLPPMLEVVPPPIQDFRRDVPTRRPTRSTRRPVRLPPSRSARRAAQRIDEQEPLRLGLGIGGAVALFVGVFIPIVKLPMVGGINYLGNGDGDGVIVLVLAIVSLICMVARYYPALIATGSLVICTMLYTFLMFQHRIANLETEGNMFAPIGEALLESVSLDWGFPVLIVGAGLLIAAGLISSKRRLA